MNKASWEYLKPKVGQCPRRPNGEAATAQSISVFNSLTLQIVGSNLDNW